jgi:hypothetical protein
MPRIAYVEKNFRPATLDLIETADAIVGEYRQQGFSLTLRQLYYQMVARDIIPNSQKQYKRLGGIVSDARRAGLIDWRAIEDRTRNLESLDHWNHPDDVLKAALESFHVDKWDDQPFRVQAWVEKEALAGIVSSACTPLDVPFFSCRGFPSDSEMWLAGQRIKRYARLGQTLVILHLGDHDPSGIDMTRDIEERLWMFSNGTHFEVRRIALNYDQIEQYGPPPNPAKTTDSRYESYVERYGESSWELDALEPSVLVRLIQGQVRGLIDQEKWEERLQIERDGKDYIRAAIGREWENEND